MPSSETERLLAYQDEVEKDLALFRDLQRRLALRVADVDSRRRAGLAATDLPEFTGTTAVMSALELAATHMEYVRDAVQTQVGADGRVLQLVKRQIDE